MSARPIGEIITLILARCAQMRQFQALVSDCGTPEARKQMIMTARMGNLISDEEARLLIEVYMLETA